MNVSGFGFGAVLLATATLAAGCSDAHGIGGSASSGRTRTPAATSEATPSAPSSSRRPAPHNYGADLKRAIASLPKGSVSVAAVNLKTGVQINGGSRSGQWMASTYKLFLTEAQLATNGSVDDDDAAAAIEQSDNAAGYRLYLALGGTGGTIAASHQFGLKHTRLPGNAYDPTFTTTSATDWVRILRNLVGPGQLTSGQRKYVLSLMEQVDTDQRWGVGAAATGWFVNKNGWETADSTNIPPEPADGGRWITNSVGIVTRHGQRLLMAVLTQHNSTFDNGIHLVQKLAVLAGAAVTS